MFKEKYHCLNPTIFAALVLQ